MICSVCKGTGMVNLPHLPSNNGGWIDEKYIFSGIECGACNGSGYVEDPEAIINEKGENKMENEAEIGKVVKYFAHPQVAWIELNGKIHIGDTIHIKGATTDFTCTVKSLRNDDDVDVDEAGAGEEIGIKVPDKARDHDKIYRVD
jgi:putative protease